MSSSSSGDKPTWRDRATHFTWPWFATTMSTGAVAVVLAQTPNRFNGLEAIGKIFFILDLVLFLAFSVMITIRFMLRPYHLLASLHHPTESLFFGAYWVSVSLIITCAQSYGVPSTGPWLIKALEVVFWLYCGIVLVIAIFQYSFLFCEERLQVDNAMPAWIFPIYPLLVVGPMAATIIPTQPEDAAYTIWIGAVTMQGLGWIVALLQYSIYMQRLMSSSLPSPPARPGMYVSVGPAGYTSAALTALGTSASGLLPSNAFGSIPAGDIARVVGILDGIFLFLFSFWFFAMSTVAVLTGVRRMSFTLNWWAFVFPNAGLTLAAIQLGEALESDAINGVTSAMTLALVIMWIFVAVAHVRAVWLCQIMFPGKDENSDMDDRERWGRMGLAEKTARDEA